MKKIAPPSNEMLDYIKQNMKIDNGIVVWSCTKFKRKAGQACGWTDDAGYQRIGLPNGKFVRGHQVSYFLNTEGWPTSYVDHIDGNRLNNSPENLRLVDDFGNSRNTRATKNKTGYKGVSFASGSTTTTFKSEIMTDGIREYLGSFKTAEDAFNAYKEASLKSHGEHSPYAATELQA